MIIINEEVLGKRLDKYGITSNQKALQFGIVLIKYYKYIGKSTIEIEELMKEKINIKNCDNELLSSYIYNTLMININIHGELRNQPITLNQSEMNILYNIANDRFRRFTYIMIILCKAFNNKLKVRKKELMRLAELTPSTLEFDRMFDKLLKLGYVDAKVMRYKIRESNQTAFYYCLTDSFFEETQNDSPVVITVHDTNNPIIFYNEVFSKGHMEQCIECGCPFFKKPQQNRMKPICPDCRDFQRQMQC